MFLYVQFSLVCYLYNPISNTAEKVAGIFFLYFFLNPRTSLVVKDEGRVPFYRGSYYLYDINLNAFA